MSEACRIAAQVITACFLKRMAETARVIPSRLRSATMHAWVGFKTIGAVSESRSFHHGRRETTRLVINSERKNMNKRIGKACDHGFHAAIPHACPTSQPCLTWRGEGYRFLITCWERTLGTVSEMQINLWCSASKRIRRVRCQCCHLQH